MPLQFCTQRVPIKNPAESQPDALSARLRFSLRTDQGPTQFASQFASPPAGSVRGTIMRVLIAYGVLGLGEGLLQFLVFEKDGVMESAT